jgi:hypothetical protein
VHINTLEKYNYKMKETQNLNNKYLKIRLKDLIWIRVKIQNKVVSDIDYTRDTYSKLG